MSRRKQTKPRFFNVVDDEPGGESCLLEESVRDPSVNRVYLSPGGRRQEPACCSLSPVSKVDERGDVSPCQELSDSDQNSCEENQSAHLSTDDEPGECPVCLRPFKGQRQLVRHLSLHRGEVGLHRGEVGYRCSLCTFVFSNFNHLRTHMQVHVNGDASPQPVNVEGRVKVSLTESENANHKSTLELVNHTDIPTNGKGPANRKKGDEVKGSFQCFQCPQLSFKTQIDLNSHIIEAHYNKPSTRCSECDTTFQSVFELEKHTCKSNLPSARSPAVPSAANNSHELPGSPKPEYQCPYCAKQSLHQAFSSLPALERHILSKHSGKSLSLYACPKCDAGFPSVPSLNKHIEVIHEGRGKELVGDGADETGPLSLMCTRCPALFDTPAQLQEHKKAHPGNSVGRRGSIKTLSQGRTASVYSLKGKSPGKRSYQESEVDGPLDLSALKTPKLEDRNGSPFHVGVMSPCPFCSQEFPSQSSLLDHVKVTHYKLQDQDLPPGGADGLYRCNKCDESVSSQALLDVHLATRHLLVMKREFCCPSCVPRRVFLQREKLQTHLMVDHCRQLFRCELCPGPVVFDSYVEAQLHLNTAHTVEALKYRCSLCEKDFLTESEWETHAETTHQGSTPIFNSQSISGFHGSSHSCAYCNASFTSDFQLQHHLLSHRQPYSCPLCSENFFVEYARDRHMETAHPTSPPVGSSHANGSSHIKHNSSSSPSPDTLSKRHLAMLAGESTIDDEEGLQISVVYRCKICDVSFVNETAYTDHRKKAHALKSWPKANYQHHNDVPSSKPAMFGTVCSKCGKAFRSRAELEKHGRSHYGPVTMPTCSICDTACESLESLANHRLLHCKVDRGNQSCVVCGACVMSVGDYFEHSKCHVEEDSTVVCCVCKQNLNSKVELEVHGNYHFNSKEKLVQNCLMCKQPVGEEYTLKKDLNGSIKGSICIKCASSPVSVGFPVPFFSSSPNNRPKSTNSISSGEAAGSTTPDLPLKVIELTCPSCKMSFESVYKLESHACIMSKTNAPNKEISFCADCKKTPVKVSGETSSSVCSDCHAGKSNAGNHSNSLYCSKCKLTFLTRYRFEKHHCVAYGEDQPCAGCKLTFNHCQLLYRDGLGKICKPCASAYDMASSAVSEPEVAAKNETSGNKPMKGQSKIPDKLDGKDKQESSEIKVLKQVQDASRNATNGKFYQCIKCQESFTCEKDIQAHVISVHIAKEGASTHECLLCASSFNTPAKLQCHLIDHETPAGEKPACPMCSYEGHISANVQQHVLAVHGLLGRPFPCLRCNLSFFFKSELMNHVLLLHRNESSSPSSVESAKKSISSQSNKSKLPIIKQEMEVD